MPNVLVRDVEVTVLEKLKSRAASKGRSLQSEVKIILQEAAMINRPLSELETARKIRASLSVKNQSDSTDLLREERAR